MLVTESFSNDEFATGMEDPPTASFQPPHSAQAGFGVFCLLSWDVLLEDEPQGSRQPAWTLHHLTGVFEAGVTPAAVLPP